MFHLYGSPAEKTKRFLSKWDTYKCLPSVCWFWSLNVIDSTNGTVGVCCLFFFLPYDWLESNNPLHRELNEGEKNKSSLSQTHFLSFSRACWSNWFLFYLILPGKQNLCAKWLYCPHPLNLKLGLFSLLYLWEQMLVSDSSITWNGTNLNNLIKAHLLLPVLLQRLF